MIMGNYRDSQLMFGVESTYGTAVTLNRWLAYTGNSGFDLAPEDKESEELLPGTVQDSTATYRTVQAAAGSIEFEAKAKGMGFLRDCGLGSSSSTLVSGTTYQQVHKPLGSGVAPFLKSLTAQFAQQLVDGTDDADTFTGVTVKSIEWKMDAAGILTEAYDFDARNMVKNISRGSASTTARNRFGFAGLTGLTGTLTEPTTTALASATDALTALRSFSVKVENTLVVDDYRANGTGLKAQPAVEMQEITGEMVLDYDAQGLALRNSWVNNSGLTPLLFNLSTGVALSAGAETLQFSLPAVKFTNPATPNRDGKMPQITLQFKAYKLATAGAALAVVARTSDAAL